MPAAGPQPDPQCGGREPESGPAADRGGDDPDAVRLAPGLIHDRPVVWADQEAGVCVESCVVAYWGLLDGVVEDDGRDGGSGGSDLFSHPGDTTTREPDPLKEAAQLTVNSARHVLEQGSTALTS